LRRRLPSRHVPEDGEIAPELESELESATGWMYPWELAPGKSAPVLSTILPKVHETRLAMLEAAATRVLAEAGPGATVLDLACNEGWFGHRMLDLGASKVLGLDIREVNIRRARLVADQLGYSEDRLEFRQADVFAIDPAELGQFDVVLLLGLIYHVENPVGAVRLAKECTRTLCVIEAQLHSQAEPLEWGMGPDNRHLQEASFAAYLEPDPELNPVASGIGVLSLIPNRAAVEAMAQVAGFSRVEQCPPPPEASDFYIRGDRGQFLCWI
jgi:tRNA (mo5U34)-methyltransferase